MGTSTLVALALAEVFLRLFPGVLSEEAQLKIHWRELINQKILSRPDPYVGFLYPTGYEGEIRRGELLFAYKTDENGFRNPSPWPSRAEVVAVGDSLTFGYGVDDGQTWTALLAQHLLPNRLVNLGLIGAGPEQYFRIYERFGVPLAPKVLLFGLLPANDITDAVDFERWLEAGGKGNYDVWRFFGGDVPGLRRGIVNFAKKSYLLQYLRDTYKLLRSPSAYRGRTLNLPGGCRLRLAPNIVARATRNAIPGHPDFQLVLEAIERTRRLTQEHDTHLLVLLFPSKEEVYLPIMDEPAPRAVQPFATALEEKGIDVLDLTAPLQERARAGACLFHEVDGHPDAAGYEVIADTVLRHLEQNAGKYQLVNWRTDTR